MSRSETYWIDEPWIYAVDYRGSVAVDDARRVIARCLIALHEHPVYFLIDFTDAQSVSPDIMELSSLSEWIYHPNGRWFAYVQPTGIVKKLIQLRHHSNCQFFNTREEALVFLRKAVRQIANG